MFSIPKKYVHDKLVLLLISINAFFALAATVVIALRLGTGQEANGYFVQYRPELGISAYTAGGTIDMIGFVVFAILMFIATLLLSVHAYKIRRELSLVILYVGMFLLVANAIISNGLLQLH